MNKKFPALVPLMVIIACSLPSALGLGIVSSVLISAYLTSYLAEKGFKSYIIYAVLSGGALFLSSFGDIISFMVYYPLSLFISLTLGICIKRGRSLAHTVTASSLCTIVLFTGMIFIGMKKFSVSAVSLIFGNYFNTLKSALATTGEMATTILPVIDMLQKQLDLFLPSFIVVSAGLLSYFTFGIARGFLGRRNIKLKMRHLYELRLMPSFTFIFVVIDLISLIMGNNAFFANVNVVLSTIFVMCGVSVVDFYLDLKGIATPVRIIIYAGAFLLSSFTGILGSLLVSVLQFTGLIDSIRPLRRIPSGRFKG